MRREYWGDCTLASTVGEVLYDPSRWEDSIAFWAVFFLWKEHLSFLCENSYQPVEPHHLG